MSPQPQVPQPMGSSVAAPSGYVPQLGEGGLGVSGAVETRERPPIELPPSSRDRQPPL